MRAYVKKISEEIKENNTILFEGLERRKVTNYSQLTPGDVFIFKYKGEDYSVLIVETKRTGRGSGFFISTKNNILISTIKINFNLQIHNMFIANLYKNERKSNYNKLASKRSTWLSKWFSFAKGAARDRILSGIMGKNNYRTFIFPEMKDIRKLNLGV